MTRQLCRMRLRPQATMAFVVVAAAFMSAERTRP